MTSELITEIDQIVSTDTDTDADAATWVGQIDRRSSFSDVVKLGGQGDFSSARILVRDGDVTVGFVELPAFASALSGSQLRSAVDALPHPVRPTRASQPTPPPVSVVVCTRDRTEQLERALSHIRRLDYPDFEIVVVDNAASDLNTWKYVDSLDDPRVSVVHEFVPGLAAARNRGIRAARHSIIAFTDDDVVVDSKWLNALVAPFADPAVACVTGMVPSMELKTRAQLVFDRRVSWASSTSYEEYSLYSPPGDHLFPFRVGRFGTGANFAVRTGCVFALGGFDEALGAGAPTKGGEDIDWFVRTLVAGYSLVYQPDAVVWHAHRAEFDALEAQAHGYGVGLGAWITKALLDPDLRRVALRRAPAALAHLATSLRHRSSSAVDDDSGAGRAEVRGIVAGPRAYFRARNQGRRPHPLRVHNRATRSSPS